MASGMKVEQEAQAAMNKVYKNQLSGCVLKIDEDKQVVVLEKGTALKKNHRKPLRKVCKKFKDDNCRFAVVNCHCTDKDSGGEILKTACIMWSSDNASIKSRMKNTTTFAAVKNVLGGNAVAVEMCDKDQQKVGHVMEKILAGKKEASHFEGKKVRYDKHHTYEFESSDSDTDSGDESD